VPKLVLVVDDDQDQREVLSALLESAGYAVAQATDGREALAKAKARRPKVIILDLMMPTMNGWDFRTAQRRDSAIADVPVVVVSANCARLDELRPAAFLAKPFDLGRLLETIEALAA